MNVCDQTFGDESNRIRRKIHQFDLIAAHRMFMDGCKVHRHHFRTHSVGRSFDMDTASRATHSNSTRAEITIVSIKITFHGARSKHILRFFNFLTRF